MGFKDHFSDQSALYARARPDYPPALFRWLAENAPGRRLAWDAGTGNGQAALGLAEYFAEVLATDPSLAQLEQATPHPRVHYQQAPAEACPLHDGSADLVCAAQALHWFDQPAFFAEARRVLQPNGLVAVWSYKLLRVTPAIDTLIEHLYRDILGPWWPPERRLVDQGYADLDFPFAELAAPSFTMSLRWDRSRLLDYLSSWSAVARYRAAGGEDPVAAVAPSIAAVWGLAEVHAVQWPLVLRVGRV